MAPSSRHHIKNHRIRTKTRIKATHHRAAMPLLNDDLGGATGLTDGGFAGGVCSGFLGVALRCAAVRAGTLSDFPAA